MRKDLVTILILLLQSIMVLRQSDTLSYESIVSFYNNKTNMIDFYQLSGNDDKVSELSKERDCYIDALEDSYGKGLFFKSSLLSIMI